MKPKILITDSHDKTLLAPQYIKHLLRKGYDVISFYQSEYYIPKNLLQKLFFRLFPDYFYKKANIELLNLVLKEKPNVVLLFKAMEIYPETLCKIYNYTDLLINYNPDHPFEFVSRASGNSNVIKSIPLYDLHITYSQRIKKQLVDRYPDISCEILPFGFELKEEDYISFQLLKEINKVAFIGYCDKQRADIIRFIISNNIEVDVYGEKWDVFFKDRPDQLQIFKGVTGVEYYEVLSKYRVQLNLLRDHNLDSHNMRSFEIPGCGGIMVTPNTAEHERYFVDKKEAFLFKNNDELVTILKFLINLPEEEAKFIRLCARKKSIESGYTYEKRSEQLIKIINKYNENRR